MISVTTDSTPPRDRAEFWAHLLNRHVRPMRIEPGGEGALRGEIEARPVGGLRVARVSGVGINALHTRAQVARGDGRLYGVCVSLEGEARTTRRSETIALGPRDRLACGPDQRHRLGSRPPPRGAACALRLPEEAVKGSNIVRGRGVPMQNGDLPSANFTYT